MTDGIIQEEFKIFMSNSAINLDGKTTQEIYKLQDKLIEKIRQNIHSYGFYGEYQAVTVEDLIGDNQE